MDAQELRNLQEAYREVVENKQLDEISQKTATRAYAASKTGEFEGKDSPRDVKRSDNLKRQIKRKFGDKAVKHANRAAHARTFGRKGLGGMPPKPTKEEVDLYDIILSYLLDEGYAETPEEAEVIMVNMSNEAYKPLPKGKVDKKMASKAVGAVKHQVAATWGDQKKSSENQEKANKLGSQAKKMAQISTEKNKEANSRRRGVWSKHKTEVKRRTKHMDDIAKQQRERGYGSTTKKEEVDIYDIILSHLLDEGYAETPEAAEAIMVNMSEDWRQSIIDCD